MTIFLIYLLFFLILLTAAYGAISAAPWLPTKNRDISRMIALAEIKAGDKVYDLGCGDGRLVFAAAKKGAEAVGIEIFILPYLYAKIKSYFQPRTKILFGDMFNLSVADADVVFIFLMSKSYQKLLIKLEKELKAGSRVVCSCWPIENWQNKLKKIDQPTNSLPLFLYII